MARITYIEHDGTAHALDIADGFSVMEGAVNNGVPGIDAECGGGCACATCKVFVDDAWIAKVGIAEDMEKDMLEFAECDGASVRLSCQIKVSDLLDGLIVRLPESQQ